jgi:uncharacterized protein YbaR (Trm112 family)
LALDKELLEILACPLDKKPVRLEGDRLVCTECGRRYPIVDDIPVMLVEEAELPEGAERPEGQQG